MKIIRTLLSHHFLDSFGLYGVAPPAIPTREETAELYQRNKRRRNPNRLPARYRAIRDAAEAHLRARRAMA